MSQHGHYRKDVSRLEWVDIYRVAALFGVDDSSGATQHALKKILMPGQRGSKGLRQDLQEAVDSLNRRIQMLDEDAGWTDEAIKAAALPADPLMCGGRPSGCWVCQPGVTPFNLKGPVGRRAVEWPTEERIDAIGQNGNEGEHYPAGLVE